MTRHQQAVPRATQQPRAVTVAEKRATCCTSRGRAVQRRSASAADAGAAVCSCTARQPRGGAEARMLSSARSAAAEAVREIGAKRQEAEQNVVCACTKIHAPPPHGPGPTTAADSASRGDDRSTAGTFKTHALRPEPVPATPSTSLVPAAPRDSSSAGESAHVVCHGCRRGSSRSCDARDCLNDDTCCCCGRGCGRCCSELSASRRGEPVGKRRPAASRACGRGARKAGELESAGYRCGACWRCASAAAARAKHRAALALANLGRGPADRRGCSVRAPRVRQHWQPVLRQRHASGAARARAVRCARAPSLARAASARPVRSHAALSRCAGARARPGR